MGVKIRRYFAGFTGAQAKWLNKMSAKGYRLSKVYTWEYEFEPCEPNTYEYQVEYVGDKPKEYTENYKQLLEDMGYRVFYKNINLNYSAGKVAYNPFAPKGARVISEATTLNKELLIIERSQEDAPFELHTTPADKALYLLRMRNIWLYWVLFCLIFAVLGLLQGHSLICLLPVLPLAVVIFFQIRIIKLKKEASIQDN